jgi:hypothetical protein
MFSLNDVVTKQIANHQDIVAAAIGIATDEIVLLTLTEHRAFYAVIMGFRPGIYLSW